MKGGDRKDPSMGVEKLGSRLFRLYIARRLRKHAGNCPQAAGDPIGMLLAQHRLFKRQVLFQLFGDMRIGGIANREAEQRFACAGILQSPRVKKQMPGRPALAHDVEFVIRDLGEAASGGFQQRKELRHVPIPASQFGKPVSHGAALIKAKGLAERGAGRNHDEVIIQQQERRCGEIDKRESKIVRDRPIGRRLDSHGFLPKFVELHSPSLSRTSRKFPFSSESHTVRKWLLKP